MPRFTQQQFDDALAAMIQKITESGATRCRVVARDLHQAVVGGSQPNRMPMACNAMWKLAEDLSHTVVRRTPSGQSGSLEIEYRVAPTVNTDATSQMPPRARAPQATSPLGYQARGTRRLTKEEVEELVAADESLQAQDLSGADLTKANLFDTDLRLANLCDAILRRVDLSCADLTGADLMRADLTGANCGAADFTEANLRNATLVRCDLTDADLTRADLTDADLTGANLYRAEVAGAVVVGVKLDRATTLSGQQRSVTLTRADLQKAGAIIVSPEDERQVQVGCAVAAVTRRLTKEEVEELAAADESLQAQDLSGADLTKANLFDTDLRLANLCDAILRRANLMDADLTGADLMRADLTGANCGGADFTEANLRNATLVRCDLIEADLTKADLTDADLTGANLLGAELAGAVLIGVKLDSSTTLSGHQRSVPLTMVDLQKAGAITASPEEERRAWTVMAVLAVCVAALLLWWLL